MGKYFPPSLQSRGTAVRGGYGPTNYDTSGTTEIFFNMPRQNDVDSLFGLDGSEGGHVQFTLKTKNNNTSVFDTAYTPDYVTIYFNAKTNYSPDGSLLPNTIAQIIYHGADLYSLAFSNRIYKNPNTGESGPIADTDYTIQVRFGDNALSAANQWVPYPTEVDGLQMLFTGFASWRANAVAHSEFGEWSNTQTFYAYGPYSAVLKADTSKWLPTFTFEYTTKYSDAITNIEIRCQYILPSGEVKTESENFSGDLGSPGHFKITRSVNIAPTDTLYIQVVPITEHNTLINDPLYMTHIPANPSDNGIAFGPYSNDTYPGGKIDDGDPSLPAGDLGRAPLLVSEERKDGVIAKRILSPVINGINAPYSLNVYRFDYFTREAVLIASNIDLSAGAAPYIFKDYCVEMGERYQYAGVVQDKLGNEGLMLWEMFSPFISGSSPYAELDKLEFSVLTSKHCQLRFQGNPTVSNFKHEVQESFQATVGSQYPFYSRIGESNYRSLQFGGVVSINFDFTSLFLELDSVNPSYEKRGLLWEKNLIVPIEKVYDQQQISLNRRRFNINNPFIDSSAEVKRAPGPATIHSDHLLASRKKKYSTKQTSDMIFLERKFREKAMAWLSDGKPKLFRSETEGNMIVIVSAPTFTPVDGSQRMVYSVQMTLTEIAEYNLTNLLKYNILPCEIVADVEPPSTEFPGDYDENYTDGLLRFPDSDSYDIAGVQNGQPIAPILIAYEQGLRVTGGAPQPTDGSPRYIFDVVEPEFEADINLRWEQVNRNGIECLRLYGIPFPNMPARMFTARVKDSAGTVETITFQFGGSSSTGSIFTIDQIPSTVYDGNPQTPPVVVRENGVIIAPASVSYSNNINAGIATVTVELVTGGTLSKSFNILPKTVKVNPGSLWIRKPYDGTLSAADAIITGSPMPDTALPGLTIVVTPGQYNTKDVGLSKLTTVSLSLQGTGASNYTLSPVAASWNVGIITRRGATIIPDSGQSKIYGSNNPVLTYTLDPPPVPGDTFTGMLSRQPGESIGTYEITQGTLSPGGNYALAFTTGVLFEITKAPAPTLRWPQTIPISYGQSLSSAMAPVTNSFGTFNWNNPTTIPKVLNSGYPVTFAPNDTVNYDWSTTILTKNTAVTVSPLQVILSGVQGINREYDRTTNVQITSGTLIGVIGTDDVSVSYGQATISNKNIGTKKPVNFSYGLAGADASNYSVVLGGPVTVDITPKTVTIESAVGQDRPYNGSKTVNVEVSISGIISGDSVQLDYITLGEIASPMPGNNIHVVTALVLVGSDKANYVVPPIATTVNITKTTQMAPLTPVLQSVTTNAIICTTQATQEYSIDGGVTWQNSAFFVGLNPLTTYNVIGRYKETAIALPSLPSIPRTVDTLPLDISYSVIGFTGEYNGVNHGAIAVLEPSASIMYSADNGATYTETASPTFKNVGTYTIFYRIRKAGASDIFNTVKIIINKKQVTVTADNKTKGLGSPDPVLTYTVSPPIIVGDSFSGALARAAGEAAGNYSITRGTLALSSNYAMSFEAGTLNIGGAVITITPNSGQSKEFSDNDPVITYTFSPPLQSGDELAGELGRSQGENAGTYAITIGSLTAPSSYALILEPEIFTIEKKPVTLTAAAKTKVFGTVDPPLTYTSTPDVGNVFTGSLTRAAGENVATYPILQGTVNNPNFDITFSGNMLTISRAPISRTYESFINTYEYTGYPIEPIIELIDSSTSELLDQGTDYTLSYLNNTHVGTATITVHGIGNYQLSKNLNFQITPIVTSLTIDPIPDVTYTGHAVTPAPVVKDGTKTLTLNSDYTLLYSNNVDVGSATISVTGIGPYAGNSAIGYFNIVKATYTSTISNLSEFTRVYSPTAAHPAPIVSNNPENGIVTGYYSTTVDGTYTTTAPLNAGTYYVKARISETENYLQVETTPSSFTISPMVTTFSTFTTPSGLTIMYDADAHQPGIPIVAGIQLIKGVDYTISPNSAVTNAGDYEWTYTGIGNYVGSTGLFELTITKYPVSVQLLGANAKTYGDPDPSFAYNASPLLGSDTLSGSPGRAAGENAGAHVLTLGTLTGGVNYQLTIAESSADSFIIFPRSLVSYNETWTAGDVSATEFSHTGAAIKPVVVNWNSSVVPVVGTDIEYSYSNNIAKGNAQATATAISMNFTGSTTFNFVIK